MHSSGSDGVFGLIFSHHDQIFLLRQNYPRKNSPPLAANWKDSRISELEAQLRSQTAAKETAECVSVGSRRTMKLQDWAMKGARATNTRLEPIIQPRDLMLAVSNRLCQARTEGSKSHEHSIEADHTFTRPHASDVKRGVYRIRTA